MRWPDWLGRAPNIVAEALSPVADPLAAALRAGPPGPPFRVAAALARALLPPVAGDPPPAWLRPEQRLSFGRALAAVREYRGALLADPVGTGKTYVALAVAATLEPRRDIHVVAPSTLHGQWLEAGRRTGRTILFHSHETLSRGRAPVPAAGPVIVDECHRFRTPAARRYQTLAPWCQGRRGLLLSATPQVNRTEDVAHQLLLLVRDDALAWTGLLSLKTRRGSAATLGLARLVVTGSDRSDLLPSRIEGSIRIHARPDSTLERVRQRLGLLRLAGEPAPRALLHGVLLRALASSPIALLEVLRRYHSLLLHARDAAREGRRVSRAAIRSLAGPDGDQLVLWPMLPSDDAAGLGLALEDLGPLQDLAAMVRRWSRRPGAKVLALERLLGDRKPTLVFTGYRATVRFLRDVLQGPGIAWCTGDGAGLDGATLPRETVLEWFRAGRGGGPGPVILLATDVAAEGLDLRRIERVVHYDLPWTAVRLEQRSGRAVRLGATHREVRVTRFLPPKALADELRSLEILAAKARLPEPLGLGASTDAPWKRSAGLAERWAAIVPHEGVAVWPKGREGVVAGFRLVSAGGVKREVVLARRGLVWSGEPGPVMALLDSVQCDDEGPCPTPAPGMVRAVEGQLAAVVREALRHCNGERLAAAGQRPETGRLMRRLDSLARQAVQTRNLARLELVQRGMRFLGRGHTAGEAMLLERWQAASDGEIFSFLERLPCDPAPHHVEAVEMIGVLWVGCPDGNAHHGPVRPRRHAARLGAADP